MSFIINAYNAIKQKIENITYTNEKEEVVPIQEYFSNKDRLSVNSIIKIISGSLLVVPKEYFKSSSTLLNFKVEKLVEITPTNNLMEILDHLEGQLKVLFANSKKVNLLHLIAEKANLHDKTTKMLYKQLEDIHEEELSDFKTYTIISNLVQKNNGVNRPCCINAFTGIHVRI